MGGDAAFSGTTYQARVLACVAVHVLTQRPLRWLGWLDDTPQALAGETSGPGDDARVELRPRAPAFEIQAKHGLTAGKELDKVITGLAGVPPGERAVHVVLVVDRGSTTGLYTEFATDLDRLRAGRQDPLHDTATRLLSAGIDEAVLRRLSVVAVDVDRPSDPETARAMTEIETVLVDSAQAAAAWTILAEDAGEMCARRGRRDRAQLVALLAGKGIGVKPPPRDERWQRRLDNTRDLLLGEYPAAALAQLDGIEVDLEAHTRSGAEVDPPVRARYWAQRAAALRLLERHREALECAYRALDIEPSNLHALRHGALAAMRGGDPATARALSKRAVAGAPDDADAWSVRAQVAAGVGDAPPEPPPAVAAAWEYRLARASVALDASDWPDVLALTSALFAQDRRTKEVLYFRLIALSSAEPETQDRAGLDEADRLATELLDVLADEGHRWYAKALIMRAEARRLLGRQAESDADLARAYQLVQDDPDAIRSFAQARLREGNAAAALDALRHPRVDGRPSLLVMRAHAQAETEDDDGARATLRQVLAGTIDGPYANGIRMYGAEVALGISDADLADEFLAGVDAEWRAANPRVRAYGGRAAFLRGDVDRGVADFEGVIAADPGSGAAWLGELAEHLQRGGRPKEAVARFEQLAEQLPGAAFPPGRLRAYAIALAEAGRLADAQGVLDRLSARVPADETPVWALQLGTDLAVRREDPDTAVANLRRLAARGPLTVPAQIEFAQRLIEADRPADAGPLIAALRDTAGLPPIDRVRIAQLLHAVGRTEEAIPIAFRAFRDAPGIAATHRALIVIAMFSNAWVPATDAVGPDTYVRLRHSGGLKAGTGTNADVREHLIYGDPPIDRLRDELSVADADTLGLTGCRVGDTIVSDADQWNERRWTVEEILPAIVYVTRQAADSFHARFPDEPFLLSTASVGDGTAVDDMAALIASTHARREQVEKAFAAHRDNSLVLECLAQLTGTNVTAVMAQLMAFADRFGPLYVEWPDVDGQEESRAAARDAVRTGGGGAGLGGDGPEPDDLSNGVRPPIEVVLTQSALVTAAGLGLLDLLSEHYTLVAPRTLRSSLKRELEEAERRFEHGHMTLGVGDAGLSATEFAPGHPSLVRLRDDTRALLTWFDRTVRIEARPLESVEDPDVFWGRTRDGGAGGDVHTPVGGAPSTETAESGNAAARETSVRDFIGPASMDAAALARHRGATMYADDLALRRLFPKGARGRSFSTVGLVRGLADLGLLTEDVRDRHLLRMVDNRYATIPPSESLVEHAVRRAPELTRTTLERVFATLSGPSVMPADAARLTARVLRAAAPAPVQTMTVDDVTEFALTAMAGRWPAPTCAQLIVEAASDTLAFLPTPLRDVRRACAAFLRRRRPPVLGREAGA